MLGGSVSYDDERAGVGFGWAGMSDPARRNESSALPGRYSVCEKVTKIARCLHHNPWSVILIGPEVHLNIMQRKLTG